MGRASSLPLARLVLDSAFWIQLGSTRHGTPSYVTFEGQLGAMPTQKRPPDGPEAPSLLAVLLHPYCTGAAGLVWQHQEAPHPIAAA